MKDFEKDMLDFEENSESEYKRFSNKVTVECLIGSLIGNLVIHIIVYSLIYGLLPWLVSAK